MLPLVEYGALGRYAIISLQEGELSLVPDSPEWFDWLASLPSFRFVGKFGRLSAYRIYKQGGPTRSWKASRCAHDHQYRLYLGITPRLTLSHLEQAASNIAIPRGFTLIAELFHVDALPPLLTSAAVAEPVPCPFFALHLPPGCPFPLVYISLCYWC